VILRVTPRVAPDSMVVMEIDAERSDVGPEAEGIPIFVSTGGQTVRAPRINITTAQTTVSAANGQTIILSGLIMKTKTETRRKVPYLGDVPVVGSLFRYDFTQLKRKELLIIMTPHVILKEQDAEAVKRTEAARINWCLADILKMHGDGGLRSRQDDWSDGDTQTIHPDRKPTVDAPKPPVPAEPQLQLAPAAPPAGAPEAPWPPLAPAPGIPQTDKPPAHSPGKATVPGTPEEAAPPLPQSGGPMALPRQQSSTPPPLEIRRVPATAGGPAWQNGPGAAVPAAWQTPLPDRMVQPAVATGNDPGSVPAGPQDYGEAVADDQNILRLQR
jgi:general secretion pathway protein D